MSNSSDQNKAIFLSEIEKRTKIPEGEFEAFYNLWEFKKFKRNEFLLKAGEVPKFSIFVLSGILRQYLVNDKGEESIVYFAQERHFIGDLAALRNKSISNFNFQAIEACEILAISAENWEKAFNLFPWWTDAHLRGFQKWTSMIQEQVFESQTKTGEERYLNLIKEKPDLLQRIPQHYIASFLGLSAETLSRIRKKMFNV